MNLKRNTGHLGKVQRAVIKDLLESQLPEHEVLEKHKVNPWQYKKWLANGLFTREFNARLDARMRQGNLIMLRCFPQAAETFVKLIKSQKEETARKACFDVITLWKNDEADHLPVQKDTRDEAPQLSQEKAAKIWAILAENKTQSEKITQNPS
jgi:hypothetical protein